MKTFTFAAAQLLMANACIPDNFHVQESAPKAGWRLVRFDDDVKPVWLAPEVVDSLPEQRIGFIDVTEADPMAFHGVTQQRLSNITYPTRAEFSHQEQFDTIMRSANAQNMLDNLDHFASFPNRRHNTQDGVDSAAWLFETAQEYAAPCGATVEYFEHSWLQPSIIAKIPGTGSTDETVVWGSHQDSISMFGAAPGYDDDGSGSMTVLEGFKAVCASGTTFAKDVEFQWYAAEEVGLLGSAAVASAYANAGVNVIAMLQHDMTCYNPANSNQYNRVGIIEDYTDANLNSFVRDVIDEYTNISHAGGRCGYGCSDHASFTSAGYPSTFAFEKPYGSHSPYIHTPQDTADKCDPVFMAEYISMGVGYLVEAAN